MIFLSVILLLSNVFWLALAIQSIGSLRRIAYLPEDGEPVSTPKISIVLPARNESRNLSNALESLLAQDYSNFEILVIDDHSEDNTFEIAQEFSRRDQRVRALKGAELPDGWRGKAWALQQGAGIADGNWLLFTDADMIHDPRTIRCALGLAQREKLDLLSIAPHMNCLTFWEKVMLPFFVAILNLVRPLHKSNDPKSNVALVSGGFLMMKALIFRHVGGYEQIHDAIAEDLRLAEFFKFHAYKIKTVVSRSKWVRTRMYDSFKAIWEGLSRHAFEVSNYNPLRLCSAVLLAYAVIVTPAMVGVYAMVVHDWRLAAYCAFPIVVMVALQSVLNSRWGISLFYFFSFPLATFFYGMMMLDSMLSFYFRGGNLWKGRRYGRKTA